MEQLTVWQRIQQLFNLIVGSKAFLAIFLVLFLTIILLVINVKTKKKIFKFISVIIYLGVTVYVCITYGSAILDIGDNLVDKIFTTLYFPNYISYVCMLIISVLLFIITLINNNVSKVLKITSVGAFMLICFLFVLTVDTVNTSAIDIYDKTSVYSSDILIVLIQSSMGIFALWFAVLIVDAFVSYIARKDVVVDKTLLAKEATTIVVNADNGQSSTDISEDFKALSDESFYDIYGKYAKKSEYDDYMSIIDNE